jgi:acetyl esterase/lipase
MAGSTQTIPYLPQNARRGELDLWLPRSQSRAPWPIVLVHGGGLQAYDKSRMNGVADWLAQSGFAVLNINYRLMQDADYPAALEDVLSAIDFVLQAPLPQLPLPDRSGVIVMGLSAGGFLVSGAGLRFGRPQVRGIVSISGPSFDYPPARVPMQKGAPHQLLRPPLDLISAEAPPLLAVHSRQDTVVLPEHSVSLVDRLRGHGAPAELFLFNSVSADHGIWEDFSASAPHLIEPVKSAILTFLRSRAAG